MPEHKNAPRTYLVDLDGTTISYPEYAAYTFRAMMHRIVEVTGKPEEEVRPPMKRHYVANGIESPSLIQSMDEDGFFVGSDFKERDIIDLKRQVRTAFNAAKTNHLRPYPGMLHLLQSAQEQGNETIALTDSQGLSTISKLQGHQTSVIGPEHFSRIIAINNRPEPSLDDYEKTVHRLQRSLDIPITLIDTQKPDTDLVALFGKSRDEIAATFAALGDNYNRDMQLALNSGMRGYHALWGVLDLAKHEDTIADFYSGSGPISRAYLPPSYPDSITPVGQPEGLYKLWGIRPPAPLR